MPWTQNTCRLCAQIHAGSHLIYPKPTESEIETKIKKCLKLQIFKDDYKPKHLCNGCLMKLNDFYAFFIMCHSNDEKFEAMLLNRDWQDGAVLDYTPQKMSVIVSPKGMDQLDCNEIELPINEHEMLEIVENATNYLNQAQFYPESTVLRHSSNYQFDSYQNYDVGLDYSNYGARENLEPTFSEFVEPPVPQKERQIVESKTYPCPHCEKKFKRRLNLNAHISVHTKVRPYVCDVCQKNYATKCDLTNHLKVHTDRFRCKFCTSTFSAPSKLQRHIRTHTKDKPFICDYKNCGKSFSDKRNLDGHKTLHLNEFNFSCKACGKVFRTKNRLKQHGKAHIVDTPFKCDICSKAYKYKNTLTFHLKKHNGYYCPFCKKNCEKAVKLLRHKKLCESRPK